MNPINPATQKIEPITGTLRTVGGTRTDAAPCTATLAPPPRAARGREGEWFFILVDLTGPASPHLYRELREVVARAYWSTTGSITAALRQAATAANRHLFQFNLHSAPSDRCYGGLTCAVLHDNDLFLLQAGPTRSCVLHRDHLECFSHDEELPHLGMGRLADVRLHHTFVTIGDTLLLASPALMQEAGSAGLTRVLPRAEVQEALAGLEQVGAGADFTALVARLAVQSVIPRAKAAAAPKPPRPSLRSRLSARTRRKTSRPVSSEPIQVVEPPKPARPTRPKPARKPGPSLSERAKGSAYATGRGIASGGAGLVGAARTLFRRMLPGPEREARRRARPRRPIPSENRTAMMAAAIGIPVLLAIIVALANASFGEENRFQGLVSLAEQEIALAEADGGISAEARPHWEAALQHTKAAIELKPDDPDATALQTRIQTLLDTLAGVTRLPPIHLEDFGPSAALRQLVVHGQMIFVLDPAAGWVTKLTLNQAGDGTVEGELPPPLVKTGQQVSDGEVGSLVDCTWIESGSEWMTSGLLILEESGALVSYDPAWGSEEGTPQLARSFLGAPPAERPKAVGSYQDRFYVLDPAANQVWRYEPQGDTYPEPPNPYFVTSPPKPLGIALDMAIDGSIYILYDDGEVLKFLGGEIETFEIRGLLDPISQTVTLAVDPHSGSGNVYVADRGNKRILKFGPDGAFLAQLCAEVAFDELEALAVDEAARRLYVFSGGKLYVAPLP